MMREARGSAGRAPGQDEEVSHDRPGAAEDAAQRRWTSWLIPNVLYPSLSAA